MALQNPLNIQELLDLCIGFVSESRPTILSCSLVARAWVDTAQSHLFHNPLCIPQRHSRADTDAMALKFLDALQLSPHLARHVRALHFIQVEPDSTVEQICTFDFTHLEKLTIEVEDWIEYWQSEALLRVLSLPTLRFLAIYSTVPVPSSCETLFRRLSPRIQHLKLACPPWDLREIQAGGHAASPMRLKSLRLDADPAQCLHLGIMDISNLLALSVWHEDKISWNMILHRTIQSLRILNLRLSIFEEDWVDLSIFPNLEVFRVDHAYTLSALCHTVTTVPSPRVIIIAVFYLNFEHDECDVFDRILGSFDSSPLPIV
ncbi:hypothetical protein R3P38DRAFT_3298527 [Favolaschia claudopus]|uniref:F-box domain-containing protein n=1 Tax=Favolaschia claudopus TaxID=2862362 RepID=A0AAV9Z3E6_9AGAR